tara:strand:+ start:1010 stop:1579 length:570 start_codon:yes stop_codon:yes gene_type:complete
MNELSNEEQEVSQLDILKARADVLGLKYHPAIGHEKLAAKIAEVLEAKDVKEVVAQPVNKSTVTLTPGQRRQKIKKAATKLQRVRIACMNPNKREWQGETFSVGNTLLGQVKKYVPYGKEWHVPQIILNAIEERKCQVFTTETNGRGQRTRQGKLVNEFSIEVLSDLTGKELHDLAQRQAMAAGTTEYV